MRAFCTATSQLNRVAFDDVQNVPSTVGATPSELGLLTTVMNTCADLAARQPDAGTRGAGAIRGGDDDVGDFVAVSRAAPPGSGTADGSAMMGWRNSPVSPPKVTTG